MLEELQRLQAHLDVLKTRLAQYEQDQHLLKTENTTQKSLISEKQAQISTLTEQLSGANQKLKQLNTDANSIADRYNRLDKSCTDLKNRFQEILSERNELRAVKEKLQNEQRQSQLDIQTLKQERERLLQKNDQAKLKVEAIIERLAILGTLEDPNTQELQQFEHPTDSQEDTTA